MTFSSILIVLFLFLLAGLLVMRPFLEGDKKYGPSGTGRYDSLQAERERLYGAIEELDLELDLDKISQEEHDQRRNELLVEAAAVLKKIEALPSAKKKKEAAQPPAVQEDELERMIAERRKALQEARAASCPNCGKAVSPDDQFCSHCGAELS